MSTSFLTKEEARADRKWHIIDAAGKPVGRIATAAATLLRGKHKPAFTPHNECGDCVIVINAAQVVLTGNKLEDKLYRRHSMYFGGLKTTTARKIMETRPERIIEFAVWGMLPGGKQSKSLMTHLKIYTDATHPHGPQKPEAFEVKTNLQKKKKK